MRREGKGIVENPSRDKNLIVSYQEESSKGQLKKQILCEIFY